VFIDEAGSTISMTPTHGRAPRGRRVSEAVPRNRGTVTTIIGALTLRGGLVAAMTLEGGTDGDAFVAYLDEVLLPVLRSGDLVVMDNAGAHRDPRVAEVLARAGAKAVYLPPYSPDLDPIELAWSNLKDFLRAAKARTVEELTNCVGLGMTLVDTQMARKFYQHCGYNAHVS
jgi:transposase